MTKHYCDICDECHDRLYAIDIYVHIKQVNPMAGHVQIIDGERHPISGVTTRTECCIACYNKVMFPTWERIQELKIEQGA